MVAVRGKVGTHFCVRLIRVDTRRASRSIWCCLICVMNLVNYVSSIDGTWTVKDKMYTKWNFRVSLTQWDKYLNYNYYLWSNNILIWNARRCVISRSRNDEFTIWKIVEIPKSDSLICSARDKKSSAVDNARQQRTNGMWWIVHVGEWRCGARPKRKLSRACLNVPRKHLVVALSGRDETGRFGRMARDPSYPRLVRMFDFSYF